VIVTGNIARRRQQSRQPAPRPLSAPRRGDRTARMLGLAHRIEQAIEDSSLRDHAHAAQVLGISRARMSQIAALLTLAPDIQARLLAGDRNIHERAIRAALRFVDWQQQRAALEGKTK
jgi:hypothetical protein